MVDKRIKKSQEKVLRASTHENIKKSLTKLTLSEALKKIYSGDLSKETAATLKSTYPTKRVEISKISVMNPANLMEVPPDEDELEKILNSNDDEETVDETAAEEVVNDEDAEESNNEVEHSSMKVAELKELLKEKNLPVSGTKAELIERLQT